MFLGNAIGTHQKASPSMHIGAQYYRPPFPVERYWRDDLRKMRDSGLNTIQLWVLWSWVEATPGEYNFQDYDQLVEIAGEVGLEVVLSTIAAVHPYWIHREFPGSEMVTNEGHAVVSSNRIECHFGLTPGGCIDHPGVRARQLDFIRAVARQYADTPHLLGWDAWNELRWDVHADGLVCYCPHTVERFGEWLDAKYGGLDGLNAAWLRRYSDWQDVRPGKKPPRPYTEMMAFEHFLTCRSNEHGRERMAAIREIDAERPVTLHADWPAPLKTYNEQSTALNRGNDFALAEMADAFGSSAFPMWFETPKVWEAHEYSAKMECIRSAGEAAGHNRIWLSEIQGGMVANMDRPHHPVDHRSQQFWLWNAQAVGVETLLFWCWRDEVFGSESNGFGLDGHDFLADDRLAAMRHTEKVLAENRDLLANYKPCRGEVGVLFSPQSHYHQWAATGSNRDTTKAMLSYCRALQASSIPYVVVEEERLAKQLPGLKALLLPRATALSSATCEAILDFARQGGLVLAESECGAFDERGLFRYAEDRFYVAQTGLRETCRRFLPEEDLLATLDGQSYRLPAHKWLTPIRPGSRGEAIAPGGAEGAAIARAPLGEGQFVLCGSYLGEGFANAHAMDFVRFLRTLLAEAAVHPPISVQADDDLLTRQVYLRHGRSGETPVLFVFFLGDAAHAELTLPEDFLPAEAVRDLIWGEHHAVFHREDGQGITLDRNDWGVSVLVPEGA
jgi:beta-galactosidase